MRSIYGTTLEARVLIRKLNQITQQADRLMKMCESIRDEVGEVGDERWMHSGQCRHCGESFDSFRADAKYCSQKCQKAYARKKIAEKVGG